jgi:hypothetical protein
MTKYRIKYYLSVPTVQIVSHEYVVEANSPEIAEAMLTHRIRNDVDELLTWDAEGGIDGSDLRAFLMDDNIGPEYVERS